MANEDGEFEPVEEAIKPLDPVEHVIAKYLGVDLSPEGLAAQTRKGIAIIVFGGPLSGKTTIAKQISEKYSIKILVIDAIILDTITNGTSPCAKKARSIYDQCMIEQQINTEVASMASEVSVQDSNTKSKAEKEKKTDSIRKFSEIQSVENSEESASSQGFSL